MTLLYMDGQQMTNSFVAGGAIGPIRFKWRGSVANSGWIVGGTGRWGWGALDGLGSTSDLAGQLTDVAGAYVPEDALAKGFAIFVDALPSSPWVVSGFSNASGYRVELLLYSDGRIGVQEGSGSPTVLATSVDPVYTLGAWNHIQFEASVPGAGSEFRVKVADREVVWDSANTGLSLNGGAAAQFRNFFLGHNIGGSPTTRLEVCDYYLTDGEMLGDCMVETLYPTSDGSFQGFERGLHNGGTHYQTINNHDVGSVASAPFITSFDVGNIDTFTYDDISDWADTKGVLGVQIYPTLGTERWVDRSGTPTPIENFVTAFADFVVYYAGSSSHSAEAIAAEHYFGAGVVRLLRKHYIIWETNPSAGGAAWTVGQVNAAEFGVAFASGADGGADPFNTDVTSADVTRPPTGSELTHLNVFQVPVEVLIRRPIITVSRRPPQLIGQ